MTCFKSHDVYKLRNKNTAVSYTTIIECVNSYRKYIVLDAKKDFVYSLRSGGATAAANNAVSYRLFKRHGRWRSGRAKDGYIKDNLKTLVSVSARLGL